MAGSTPEFSATITGIDHLSPIMERMGLGIERLEKRFEHLPKSLQKHEVHGFFSSLKERIAQTGEATARLHEGFAGLFERVTDMVPVLAGLGAVGAVGGIFELTAKVAETRGALVHQAEALGVSTDALLRYNFVAKMTDTNVEGVGTSLGRLGVNIAKAAGGDKNLGRLFQHLGIATRDAHGQIRTTESVMKDLFKAMRVQTSDNERGLIARTLFGRGGLDMIPMLMRSREEVDQMMNDFDRSKPSLSDDEKKSLDDYLYNWKMIEVAVGSVTVAIGGKLAQVLTPAIRTLSDFLIDHKDAIANFIGNKTGILIDVLEKAPWEKIASGVGGVATGMGHVVEGMGGFKSVVELLIVVKAAAWAIGFGEGIMKIATAIKAVDLALSGTLAGRLLMLGGAALGATGAVAAEAAGMVLVPANNTPNSAQERLGLNQEANRIARDKYAAAPKSTDGHPVPLVLPFPEAGFAPVFTPQEEQRFRAGDEQWARDHQMRPRNLRVPGQSFPDGTPMPGSGSDLDHLRKPISFEFPDLPLRTLPSPYSHADASDTLTPHRVEGQVDIALTLNGLPPGSSVDARSTGAAGPVRVNVGTAFDGRWGTG